MKDRVDNQTSHDQEARSQQSEEQNQKQVTEEKSARLPQVNLAIEISRMHVDHVAGFIEEAE